MTSPWSPNRKRVGASRTSILALIAPAIAAGLVGCRSVEMEAALPAARAPAGGAGTEQPPVADRAPAAERAVDGAVAGADTPPDRSVLGYEVSCETGLEACILRRVATATGEPLPEPETVHRGALEEVQDALVARLKAEHGQGRSNLPVWSMGGKQFWADVFVYSGWRIQEHVLTDHFRLLDPEDARVTWGTYEACRTRFEAARATGEIPAPGTHWVVLVHAIFRSREAMVPLEEALREAGYEPVGVNYPSTRRSVEEHAIQLETLLDRAEGAERVSFVAHSMGGLVTRRLLARRGPWRERIRVDRVVMLGTPNQGSVVADALADFVPFQIVAGPAGQDLTAEGVAELPAPDVPFAVIAGGKGDGRGFSAALPGDDDGTVLVESTWLPGSQGYLVVEALHRNLINHPEAIAAVVRFLKGGPLAPEAGD